MRHGIRRSVTTLLAAGVLALATGPVRAALLEFTYTPDAPGGIAGSFQVDDSAFAGLSGAATLSASVVTAFDFSLGTLNWDLGGLLPTATLNFDVGATGTLPAMQSSNGPVATIGGANFLTFSSPTAAIVFDLQMVPDFGSWSTARVGGNQGPAPGVPAPGTLLLLAAAVGGLALGRRRRSA